MFYGNPLEGPGRVLYLRPGMGTRYFTPRLFSFLRSLADHNDRQWFAAHQEEYEKHLRQPALRFISDVAPALRDVAPNLVADSRKVGGSLLRIQRDLRFSADKSPYRTYLGIHFRHEQWREKHTPSVYLALRPRGSYMGVGSWRPDARTARAVRQAIVERPEVWDKAAHSPEFTEAFTLVGDSLKRPPRDFDPHHPLVEDLRRKDFAAAASLTQGMIISDRLLDHFLDHMRRGSPLLEFLARAGGVPL